MERLIEKYNKEVVPALQKRFEYKNVMQVPKLEKIIVNMRVGEAKENPKALEGAINDMRIITGQQPVVTKAKNQLQTSKSARE